MRREIAIMLAAFCGICIGMQPVVNSMLGQVTNPRLAAFHSLVTSAFIMFMVVLFSGDIRFYSNTFNARPVYLIGGFLGIVIVLSSIYIVPAIGPAKMAGIFVAVQLVTSAIIGHFGLLGVGKNPMNSTKAAGITLMMIGVRLLLK